MINNVSLIGRITHDLELKQAGETSVCKFNLAVNRDFKREGQPEADFVSCVTFGKTAEVLNQYCSKGVMIGIEGRIQTGSYTKDDGTKVYTTDVMVRQLHFLESKKESNTVQDDDLPF